MADIVIPSGLRHARSSIRYVDQTGVSRGAYNGFVQTTGFGGDHIAATIEFTPHGGKTAAEKALAAQMRAFSMELRGKQNRVYIQDSSYAPRGTWATYAGGELLANSDFSTSATWSGTAAGGSPSPLLSFTDQVMRTTTQDYNTFGTFQQPAVVLNSPIVLRAVVRRGRELATATVGISLSGTAFGDTDVTASDGYRIADIVVDTTVATVYGMYGNTGGFLSGAYADTLFSSLSRCMYVDGGGNLLLRSNSFSNASWGKSGGVAAGDNGTGGPDGTVSAQYIQETDTVNREHYIQQTVTVTSAVQDITVTVFAQANTKDWLLLRMAENTGATYSYAWFNVRTGALGVSSVAAGNFTNLRVTITAVGNSWYRCTHTARKTNAATSLSILIQTAASDGNTAYVGVASAVPMLFYEASMKADSFPSRRTATSSAAVAAATQTGTLVYVKGLPVSQNGLLLAGDWIEIDGQLKMLTAKLDSDAAGNGCLQFSPPLRRAISDNTPVIVTKPMGRFVYAGEAPGWDSEPGVFCRSTLELEEAFAP